MARVSTKENKNIYQTTRESLKLTREATSELLESIAPERIDKIEHERVLPHPDEVMLMAQKYKLPRLCNYYCANQCPIGQEYVPEIKGIDLAQIILEMVASLNAMNKEKDRLIEITVDGKISGDELADFVAIQEQLEKISIAVETYSYGLRECWLPVPLTKNSIVHISRLSRQGRVNLLRRDKNGSVIC